MGKNGCRRVITAAVVEGKMKPNKPNLFDKYLSKSDYYSPSSIYRTSYDYERKILFDRDERGFRGGGDRPLPPRGDTRAAAKSRNPRLSPTKDPGEIEAPESVKREGESSPDRAERDPKATTAAKETKKKNVDRKRLRPDRECCRA